MAVVFADTSALYAVLVDTDQSHAACREALKGLQTQQSDLMTSSFVLHETVALLQSRVGVDAVRRFHEAFAPLLEVVWIEARLYERALTSLLGAGVRGVSLTDWTSFEIMRARRVRRAFAVDPDFEKQGFEVLP